MHPARIMGVSLVYMLDKTTLAPQRQWLWQGQKADVARTTHMQVVALLRAMETVPAAGAPTWDHSTAQEINGSVPQSHGMPVQRGSSEEEGAAPVHVIGAEREALYKMYSEHIEARRHCIITTDMNPSLPCFVLATRISAAAPREACPACRAD